MKAKFFLLAAIAATMSLASCSNDEDAPNVPTDTQSKSVTIKLANVKSPVSVRSVTNAVQAGTTAKVGSLTIFFADANGKIDYNGYEADMTDGKTVIKRTYTGEEFEALTVAGQFPTFHYIDAAVTKVIVVCNPTWETEPTTEDALYATTVDIAAQQDVDDLVLIGAENLKPKTTEFDGEEGHTNVYEAKVNVLPLVARLEVAAFRYDKEDEATERKYTSMQLNHLALNKYDTKFTYSATAAADNARQEATIDDSHVWPFLETLNTDLWHNDVISGIALSNDVNWVDDKDIDNEQVFAYNVFAGAAPQLVLGMTGTKEDGATAALYLATSSLGIDTFQPGYIYRMDIVTDGTTTTVDKPFAFDDGDIDSPEKCVDVTVTVEPWQVEYLTPEF